MNSNGFRTHTTKIVPEPKKSHVGDSGDLGPAALNPDKHIGRPKNNGLNQEMNTDIFCTPTIIVPVPKKARKSYLNVFGQNNADQANQGPVGDPSHLGHPILISDNYNGRPKNNKPTYVSDLLMRKRLILSNDVRKTTLIKHDERPKESNTKRDDEDDETFFENLKKRINNDFQKNILQKTPKPVPKRLLKARKCKSFLNNETRNLMNKFRQEFANNQSRKLLSQENGMFSMARQNNSFTREEHPDSEVPQRIAERGITKDMLDHHKPDDNSLRGTPSFHEIHAKGCNHQATPPSFERNRVFPMERRCKSWTGENISEHQHPVMLQKVIERRMTNDNPMKYFETDEGSFRDRTPFNEIHAEAQNHHLTPTSSERDGVFPMKCRGHSWTGENICEHTHQVMPQKIVERRMTRDVPMKYFETDEDSLRGRQPLNEFHVETYNGQPTPSPSRSNGAFSMERRGSSWTRGNIREHSPLAMPQSVMEHNRMKDILWEHGGSDEDLYQSTPTFNDIDGEAYNRQPTPSSSQRNGAFLMDRLSNNSTRGSICEHRHPAVAQNVVERWPRKDIMFQYFKTDKKDSLHDAPSFSEIDSEDYDGQPTISSSGSNTFVKYYTKKYYQK